MYSSSLQSDSWFILKDGSLSLVLSRFSRLISLCLSLSLSLSLSVYVSIYVRSLVERRSAMNSYEGHLSRDQGAARSSPFSLSVSLSLSLSLSRLSCLVRSCRSALFDSNAEMRFVNFSRGNFGARQRQKERQRQRSFSALCQAFALLSERERETRETRESLLPAFLRANFI